MRGEHMISAYTWSPREGSSPHARGAQVLACCDVTTPGIIPACAGSTESAGWMATSLRDHPRMRGEHPCVTRSPME